MSPALKPEERTAPEHGFVTDAELAKIWGLGVKTARAALRQLERQANFPKRDPLFGHKRYYPAIRAFLQARYGLNVESPNLVWEENWDESLPQDRKRDRPTMAPGR